MIINDQSKKEYKEGWDAYGFAGAKGNLQIIRMIRDYTGTQLSKCLMKGALQFHQNDILEWIKKRHSDLYKIDIREIIKYENYKEFEDYIFFKNENIYLNTKKTPFHYAIIFNKIDMAKLLISKGEERTNNDINLFF